MSGDRAGARPRHGSPPAPGFFAGLWKPLGLRSAAMELPGLTIQFAGMDEPWHAAFLSTYRPYARDTSTEQGAFTLTLSASRSAKLDYYIEPPAPGVAENNPVFVEVEPDTAAAGHWKARACTYGLAASFSTAGGRGLAIFSRGDFDPRERAVENIIRVATAWLALSRGGLLMHAASIVKDGRAYLFFGQSGSGKSTLAAASRRGQVVSDDLSLLLASEGCGPADLVGAPFRGTYDGGPPVQGRFPVAAAFRLRKAAAGEPAAVEMMERSRILAGAIANLPFVVDQLHVGGDLFARAERVLASFPLRTLSFHAGDDSYWEAIHTAGL